MRHKEKLHPRILALATWITDILLLPENDGSVSKECGTQSNYHTYKPLPQSIMRGKHSIKGNGLNH